MQPIEIKTDAERLEIAIKRTNLPKWQIAQAAKMMAPELSRLLGGALPTRVQCQALADAVKLDVRAVFPDSLQHHAMEEKRARNGLSDGTKPNPSG